VAKPTPTQAEIDLSRTGNGVIDHDYDGSPFQPGIGTPAVVPDITSVSPSTAARPTVALSVNGHNFTLDSAVMFNGVPQPTTFVSPTLIQATVTYGGAAGAYPVIVRDPAGDTNSKTFTFT